MERIDHGAEAIRIIDACLAEEGVVLDALKRCVERGWKTAPEADEEFAIYRDSHEQSAWLLINSAKL